ncbi:MAG: YeeE/YedE family protein [Sedimenticola sp.]|uniref:YeeE/YedE family protein n=1 Tax=Sedimenticola thiotaurini TaxID=1543721 RepID=A0A558CV82_9GAMM|nr:YeeE/YedE family protein [Sedimenticola sp.]MCW8921717.1 YeeE/YedE family protein [Sedimenticola sp.]MCW8946766.1 YeeE/YedE family protein [Sedimenticola sp.]MCW8975750.1 YeeE/YedE family protein [Sedimenticola sp.]TVT52681.1 MAG: YeeE/YedE family protein [Sedimenticola thiotaurini]
MLWGGGLAFILGAVANKTNFCTMGAVSDWVNMGDTGRMRAWFLAVAVAIIGVSLFEVMSVLDTSTSRVPYRSSVFFWPRYLLGGVMFGVGMTLASGCGNKNLIRIGGGNLKSIFVVLVAGAMAYVMTRTDFYGVVFHSWMLPISPNLAAINIPDQSIGSLVGALVGAESPASLNLYFGLGLSILLLVVIFRSKDFRTSLDLVMGGLVVGLVVLGGWYITGGPMGVAWMEAVEFMDTPPPSTGTQSYTFINPMGEALTYLASPGKFSLITFGVAALFGVILGSFTYALVSRSFRIEWFVNLSDFIRHMIGAVLMGIGGVLAMGCTIGQGVTGVSTLAVGSFMAMGAIILGSALTMKVQYYKLVYEEEASFSKALLTGLVDLKLLPESLRKLEAV